MKTTCMGWSDSKKPDLHDALCCQGQRVGEWNRGFSLVELVIVCAILGVLAGVALVMINTADSELKTLVFNTRIKFVQVRFDAIKRRAPVFIDFDIDGNHLVDSNGYTIWVDRNGDNDYDGPDEHLETIILDNIISNPPTHGPEIYNPATSAGGPAAVHGGPGYSNIGDGVAIGGTSVNRFRFSPNGDTTPGSLYLYYPQGEEGSKRVLAGPWSIIVSNIGRIRVDRWNHKRPGDWDVDK